MKGIIQSEYPLLTLLLKGKLEEVKSGVTPEDLRKAIIEKSISFAIAQKDNLYITIKAKGIRTFEHFLKEAGIKIAEGSRLKKVSKYLRRCFMPCKNGVAYAGDFNAVFVNSDTLSQNYKGSPDDLFASVDGTIWIDPKFATKIMGYVVREHDTFLGTVLLNINGSCRFAKGKITAKPLADGIDVITYDIKKDISFNATPNYIHIIYQIQEPPIAIPPGECLVWRTPLNCRTEAQIINLVQSEIKAPKKKLYHAKLDIQSAIVLNLFPLFESITKELLGHILNNLNSDSIRNILGSYTLEEDSFDDRFILRDIVTHTNVEIANVPSLLRKTKVLYDTMLRRIQINKLAIKDGGNEKWQLPIVNRSLARIYISPLPNDFDEFGVWTGKGGYKENEIIQFGPNLFFSVSNPIWSANMLKIASGSDTDGDAFMCTTDKMFVEHFKSLQPFPKPKVQLPDKTLCQPNMFSEFGIKQKMKYDEQSFLVLSANDDAYLLGHVVNQCMALTQVATDENNSELEQELSEIVSKAEMVIDFTLGAEDCNIDDILMKLHSLMNKVNRVPSFLANRFLNHTTMELKYSTYISPVQKHFDEISKMVDSFYERLREMQIPRIPIEVIVPCSENINLMSKKVISRYNKKIKDKLNDGDEISDAYKYAVQDVKATYEKLNKEQRLEFTSALAANVYFKPINIEYIRLNGYSDGIAWCSWLNEKGKPEGPGLALVHLLKNSGCGFKVYKAHISYDENIPNHSSFVITDGNKIKHNGRTVGTTNAKGECEFIKDGKRDLMLELIAKRQLFAPSSDLLAVYLYKLKGCGLTKRQFLNLKSIEIVQCDNQSFAFVNGVLLNIASKTQDQIIPVGRYSVLLSEVSDTCKSVHLLIQTLKAPVAQAI